MKLPPHMATDFDRRERALLGWQKFATRARNYLLEADYSRRQGDNAGESDFRRYARQDAKTARAYFKDYLKARFS